MALLLLLSIDKEGAKLGLVVDLGCCLFIEMGSDVEEEEEDFFGFWKEEEEEGFLILDNAGEEEDVTTFICLEDMWEISWSWKMGNKKV